MPECPKCSKEIAVLHYFVPATRVYPFALGKDNQGAYGQHKTISAEDDYRCPFCGETLFTSSEDAEAFLRGDAHA